MTPPIPDTAARRLERILSIIVACALFMQNLDSTVIATALPTMARAFNADPVHMNVALTAYLFAVAMFVPASGWMADRFGTRQVFRIAIGVFTLGSILCGIAQSLPFLVAARVFQGMGGAAMLPVGRLILLRSVPKARLISAMAWVTMPALVGPVIGPPVGGFLVQYADWRWIFFINIPIGVLGIVMATLFVPDRREATGRLDVIGLALSGAALAGFLAVLELAGRGIVSNTIVAVLGAGGVAAALVYWLHARGQARPLLDFTLMRQPSFAVSVLGGSLFRIGVGATPFLLPMMMQLGFGRTAAQSGMITFAAAAGAVISKPGTTFFLRWLGFRRVLVGNAILCGIGLAVYGTFRASWPLWAFYAVLLVTGYMRSLQFTAYNTVAYADVPPARMSAATTLYSAMQQISLTVGIPISAAVLHFSRGAHTVPQPADFAQAFFVIAALSVLAAPASLLMPRDAGAEMRGRQAA